MLRLGGMKPSTSTAPSPRRHPRFGVLCVAALLLSAGLMAGCDSLGSLTKKSDPSRQRPRPRRDVGAVEQAAVSDKDKTLTVDAMVGQINGRPIFASQVFDELGTESLERRGASMPRLSFREDVTRQIYVHLRQMITDELIIAEAEQSLTEQEQMGLLQMLKQEREKIMAKFMGVQSLTRQQLQKQGMTIEEYLESRRQTVLVQKYLADRIWPKVHVSRREVEREYQDNYGKFNPEPTVVLRIILVVSASDADAVDKALEQGQPFERVAREYSVFRRSEGGLMPDYKAKLDTFDKLKGVTEPLNEQVRKLSAGQHSPRTAVTIQSQPGWGWVYLEKVEGMETRGLSDVYLTIESNLRKRKFDELSRQYMLELREKGNYTPETDMLVPLVEVAMNRYAQSE